METVFVAYGFTDENKVLVREIDDLCFWQGVRTVSGHVLGGERLPPAVQDRIKECDALIALATRQAKLDGDDAWVTHQWVHDEFRTARNGAKPAIALVERDVQWGGMNQGYEHIPFDRDRWAEALVRLANTLGHWKRRAGRRMKFRLDLNGVSPSQITTLRYRFVLRGEEGQWQEGRIVREPGGTFLFARGVTHDDQAIEIEAEAVSPRRRLCSVVTPQEVSVVLTEEAP